MATGGSIVDAHHHVWDLDVRDPAWLRDPRLAGIHRTFTVDHLRPLAEAAGVRATVLVQTVALPDETDELLAIAADDDLVAGVVGWVDLTAPDVGDRLAALLEGRHGGGLRGVRHLVQDEPDDDWLARSEVLRGLRAVGEAGLTYDLLTVPRQLPAAVRAAASTPGLVFVLDHCSKPPVAAGRLEPWAHQVRELAALPNVVCKLSGLVTEAAPDWTVADLRPYADVVLDAFGPRRLMVGSDWPVCLLAAGYDGVIGAALDLIEGLRPVERAEVLAGTASRVYRLPAAP
jgi:L-fuconolactonase